MIKNLLNLFILCLFALPSVAQNTVGLLSYNPAKAYDGYNIVYPHNQPNVYLLNNCGEIPKKTIPISCFTYITLFFQVIDSCLRGMMNYEWISEY